MTIFSDVDGNGDGNDDGAGLPFDRGEVFGLIKNDLNFAMHNEIHLPTHIILSAHKLAFGHGFKGHVDNEFPNDFRTPSSHERHFTHHLHAELCHHEFAQTKRQHRQRLMRFHATIHLPFISEESTDFYLDDIGNFPETQELVHGLQFLLIFRRIHVKVHNQRTNVADQVRDDEQTDHYSANHEYAFYRFIIRGDGDGDGDGDEMEMEMEMEMANTRVCVGFFDRANFGEHFQRKEKRSRKSLPM